MSDEKSVVRADRGANASSSVGSDISAMAARFAPAMVLVAM
jgi:hypothetical protein